METRQISSLSSKRGTVLVTTLIISTSLAVIVGGVISHSLTERRLNIRHELRLEAKNAAEALAEHGFAQLRHKFENRTNLNIDTLKPGTADALTMPASSLLGAQIDLANSELIGGTIPPFPDEHVLIDPDDPNNEFDPLRGKKVKAREIAIFAKATVNDRFGGPAITTFVSQRLQVRDAPLFAHAIFYNLDLEFHPGPGMDIYGPVHTNGNLYVQALDANHGLRFHDQVTTTGHMFKGLAYFGAEVQNQHVYWKNRDGEFKSFKHANEGGSVMFHDSKMGTGDISADFRSYASNRWNGSLETGAHGVEEYLPVAFDGYEPDDPNTIGVYDPVNSGRAIIEPGLPFGHAEYNGEIESQKIANKAGLRFVWDTTTSTVKAYNAAGTELDISKLENKLWTYKQDAMHDRRREPNNKNAHVTLVDVDVGKLKQLIESPDTNVSHKHIPNFNPNTDWNGIVYFECRSGTGDPKLNRSGIRLLNGETGPNPNQGIPSLGSDPGMTFATNNVLYVKGNYNADGALHQQNSSKHSALVPEAGEVPAALMADTVTFLSHNWNDAVSVAPGSVNNVQKAHSQGMEVAAAIVSGLVPSDAAGNGTSSGGAHNFPRFLENWGGKDFFIRGSMVCLYEAEVDRSLYSTKYYSAPNRKWGFSNLFKGGIYPPGTPLLRTYRRVDYREMNRAEYEAAVAALPW